MKNIILVSAVLAMFLSCKNSNVTADKQAGKETKQLFAKLQSLMSKGIMFGHQDDLAYGNSWYNQEGRSDVKDVCADYPALIGWELGDIELGKDRNLDSIYFSDMKRHVKDAHRRGSVNSFSWHGNNILTGGSAWDCKQNNVVKSILTDGENHEKYLVWLDALANFFHDLKDDNGQPIPVIFRMYHEHNGNWFWWCKEQCTPDEYKQLWVMTVNYLKNIKNVHNLLYGYSPSECDNEAMYLERYPGDNYVDIVGFDCYAQGSEPDQLEHYKNRMDLNLKIVTEYASAKNKIPIVGETGLESVACDTYFTEILYPVINRYKISSVLLWRNAWEPDKRNHYYVPFANHPASNDFKQFTEKSNILMCKDLVK